MALLEFTRNNKDYLNQLTSLTADDTSTRSETVKSIINRLNDENLKISDVSGLEQSPLIKYTLKRLIRGLTSSDHSNRIAFANAFTQILTHCKWLSTPFILSTVNAFCDGEKQKKSIIKESLLLIRNLFILILFQTERLYELSFDDLNKIISDIVKSSQAKNLIDLSCQSMLCLLNIMEQPTTNNETIETYKDLLIKHRNELIHSFSKLIPSPINSFKLITLTQIKLILRIYANNHHFGEDKNWKIENLDNLTIQILPSKIVLIYEFFLAPLKKSESDPSTILNIYNDAKMWKALISIYCNDENKEEKNKKFTNLCNDLFGFANENLLKAKCVSFVSQMCDIFISNGVDLEIENDILFQHILSSEILRFVTKNALKYKKSNNEFKHCRAAYDFLLKLKTFSTHSSYGSTVKSILMSSATNIYGKYKDDDFDTKTITKYKHTFWRSNTSLSRNLNEGKDFKGADRDCINALKSICYLLQEYIKKYKLEQIQSTEYLRETMGFFLQIVFFKAKGDILGQSLFENILLCAKKCLRITIQSAWHSFDGVNKGKLIKTMEQQIEYFTFQKMQFREKESFSSYMTVESINGIVEKIKMAKKDYLNDERLTAFVNFIGFVRIYYFMDTSAPNYCVNIVRFIKNVILKDFDNLTSVQFGDKIMKLVVQCIETDDMLLCCFARSVFLEFGDLYNSNSFDKLLSFISMDEQTQKDDDEKDDDNDIEMGDDDEEDIDFEDDDDDEDSVDSDDIDLDDKGNNDDEKEEKSGNDENNEDKDDEDKKQEEDEKSGDDDDDDSEESEGSDFDGIDLIDYGAFGGDDDQSDIDLENDEVNYEELERVDAALIAVFKEKEKMSETRIKAKKDRIQKRVFRFLLLFAKRYKTSPILLITLPPLLMSLWSLFDKVTNEFTKHWKKETKKEEDREKIHENIQKMKQKTTTKTIDGVPLWRFDNALKRSWSDYLYMLNKNKSKNQSKQNVDFEEQQKYFQDIMTVINEILKNSKPTMMVNADIKYNDIKSEWLRDIMLDTIELISDSPTYEHEMLGVNVLCYLTKIYELKCCKMTKEKIWKELDLNKEQKKESENEDALWLYELWFLQIKYLMRQPRRTWYFSRDFFVVLIKKNPFFVWKLVHDALKIFDTCKNSWSQQQIMSLLEDLSQCEFKFDENKKVNERLIKCVLSDTAKVVAKPLRNCLSESMDPVKKGSIAKSAGKFIRRLNRNNIDGEDKRKILDVLGASKLQWKKVKKKTKPSWKKKREIKKNEQNKKMKQLKKSKKRRMRRGKNSANPSKKRKVN